MGLISKEDKILWKAYLSKSVEKLTILLRIPKIVTNKLLPWTQKSLSNKLR